MEEQDILNSVKYAKGEQPQQFSPTLASAPQLVQETLAQQNAEKHSGISVIAHIHYESISGNLKERDFLIRRILTNKDDYFIDGLALDINAPRLIRINQIACIIDMATQTVYSDPYRYLQDVLGVELDQGKVPEPMSDYAKAIREVGNEMTILMYLVAIDGTRDAAERETVLKYVKSRVPYLNYDESRMNDYLISLAPDDESFSMAFYRVLKKGKAVIQPLMQAILDVITADGIIHDKEKAFLARFIDLLKQAGYDIELGK